MANERKLTVVLAGDAKGVTNAFKETGAGADGLQGKLSGLGGKAKLALAGAGIAAIGFAKDSIGAFMEAEQSQAKLNGAFEKFPQLAGHNTKALQSLNSELAKKTVFDDDATASGEAVLASFGLTESQLKTMAPLLQDYAARTGKDLPTAARDLGKAVDGQGKALKNVGINFKDAGSKGANFDQVIQGLSDHVGGFAENQGNTASGKLKILQNQFGELQEKVGGLLVPVLLKLADVGLKVVTFISNLNPGVLAAVGVVAGLAAGILVLNKAQAAYKAGVEAWGVVQKISTGLQWAWNAAMEANPIMLVVIGIAALVAGLVLAYEKVGWFRDFVDAAFHLISDAVGAVVGFIGEHWQLLLEILTGPIGIAVGIITSHWDTIKNAFTAVKDWISDRVGDIVGFITGIPGRIAGVVSTMWDGVKTGITAAKDWVSARIGEVVGFVTGIPGRIAGVASTMFNGLKDAITSAKDWVGGRISDIAGFFQALPGKISGFFGGLADMIKKPFTSAFDAIRNLWNSTIGKVGFTIPNWVPGGIGGNSWHFPKMHTGGIVPGGLGNEPIVQLQGGEGIFTPDQMRALSPVTGLRSLLSAATSPVASPAPVIVNLTVQGSVLAEGDLIDTVRRGLHLVATRNGWTTSL